MSLVLFDIDGTLIRNAGPHHKSALIEGVRRVTGLTCSLDGVPTQGMLDRDLILGMVSAADHYDSLADIVAECQAAYVGNCAPTLVDRLCPGVNETLAKLKSLGAVLGLVTGNLSAIGWRKIDLAGLRPYFSIGAFSDDGGTRAELAAVAVTRARELGFLQTGDRISLIGDHQNDIDAAKRNGLLSVAVATGISSRSELAAAEPDILVDNLSDLNLDLLI